MDNERILIYGVNGSGKSSIVEALEWLLYGEISRKALSECKSEYSGEYIKNKHYSGKTNPYVEVVFVKTDGVLLSIKREYTSASASQTFVNCIKAEFSTLDSLSDISCKPIMSQAEVKRFVEFQRKDKWNEILRIIGLEVLDNFREDVSQLITSKKNCPQFVDAKTFYEQILAELERFPKTNTLRSNIRKRPYNEAEVIQSIALLLEITNPKSVTTDDLNKCIKNKMEKIIQPDSLSTLDIPTDYFSNTTLSIGLKKMDSISQLFDQRKDVDKEFIKFISIGLTYVSDTICPFCEEKSLTKKRKKELEALVSVSQKKLELENQLEKEVGEQKQKLEFITFMLKDFVSKKKQLPTIIGILSKTGQYSEDVGKLSEINKLMDTDIETTLNSLEPQLQKYLTLCEDYLWKKLQYDPLELKTQKREIEPLIKKIWKLVSERASDLAQIRESILIKTTNVDKSVERIRQLLCLEKMLLKKDMLRTFALFQKKINLLDDLCNKLVSFEKTKAQQLLKALSKDVKKYYGTLNPKEQITFSGMKPSTGKSRWIIINGESYGEELNPISCFSEAHLNCLGLSLYFTQRVDRNPFWNVVILDDPVQSMDDNHSSNLVDIIADICKNKGKQIIVFSHQKSFIDVIKSKFYYNDYLYYTFSMKDKKGPEIKLTKGTLDNFIDRAKTLLNGSQDDINDGGVNLRKAIEKFCFNVLTIKHKRNAKRMQKLDLEDFLTELEKIETFDKQDIADLRTIRSTVDVGAHGNVIADIAQGDLKRGITIVEKLKQKYLS